MEPCGIQIGYLVTSHARVLETVSTMRGAHYMNTLFLRRTQTGLQSFSRIVLPGQPASASAARAPIERSNSND